MTDLKIDIEGLPQLKAALAEKVAELHAASVEAVADEAELLRADAAQHAPKVKTCDLRRSVRVEPGSSELEATVETRLRYATFVEHGTYKDKAQPFMQPASERARKRFPERAAQIIRTALGG